MLINRCLDTPRILSPSDNMQAIGLTHTVNFGASRYKSYPAEVYNQFVDPRWKGKLGRNGWKGTLRFGAKVPPSTAPGYAIQGGS